MGFEIEDLHQLENYSIKVLDSVLYHSHKKKDFVILLRP